MRPLRRILPNEVYFVTNRTFQQQFLLRPDRACNELIASWLAKAVSRYKIELFAFVFMSNHFHMLLRAPRNNLHEFMCYFQGNLARAINRLRGRQGSFWERRYTHAPVLDASAQVERLVYLLMNPVKADLVGTPSLWPGMSSIPELIDGRERVFPWFNRTAWHSAGAPSQRSPFIERHILTHGVLPAWRDTPKRKQSRILERILAEQVALLKLERRKEGRRLVSRADLTGCPPTRTPKRTLLTPRPLCHASTEESRKRFRVLWREFVDSYREASRLVAAGRRGIRNAVFPPGSFPPSLPRPWPMPP